MWVLNKWFKTAFRMVHYVLSCLCTGLVLPKRLMLDFMCCTESAYECFVHDGGTQVHDKSSCGYSEMVTFLAEDLKGTSFTTWLWGHSPHLGYI